MIGSVGRFPLVSHDGEKERDGLCLGLGFSLLDFREVFDFAFCEEMIQTGRELAGTLEHLEVFAGIFLVSVFRAEILECVWAMHIRDKAR